MSLADDIFSEQQAAGLARKRIKAWGKDLWAWELHGAAAAEYEASRIVQTGRKVKLNHKGLRGRLVQLSLRVSGEEDAALVFREEDIPRIEALGRKELDRVYTECCKIGGIDAGDDEGDEADPSRPR